MDRFEMIEWLDAIASNWGGQKYDTQRFMDRWWWELLKELDFELKEFCPGMWATHISKETR